MKTAPIFARRRTDDAPCAGLKVEIVKVMTAPLHMTVAMNCMEVNAASVINHDGHQATVFESGRAASQQKTINPSVASIRGVNKGTTCRVHVVSQWSPR